MRVFAGKATHSDDGLLFRVWWNGKPFGDGRRNRLLMDGDGFGWGAMSDSAVRLAYALLLTVTGSRRVASRLRRFFASHTIAQWSGDWVMTEEDVWNWVLQYVNTGAEGGSDGPAA